MAKLFNRAKMTTSSTGSGTVTLSAAAGGFQSFADAGVSDGDVVQYLIEEGSAWEIGTGTYSSTGTSLTRTPSESSDGGTAISLGGTANVAITAVADDLNRLQHEGSTKVSVSATGASVTGALTTSGDLTVNGEVAADLSFGDNVKAKFGASDDLQIYHDGSNSFVVDQGTGGLVLRGSTYVALQGTNGENAVIASENGAVDLRYDNATKLTTTSTGIDVTGTVTSDGLTVDGTSRFNNYIDFGGSISTPNTAAAIYRPADNQLAFSTANNERMRIDSSGNVGIGTSSPTFNSGSGLEISRSGTASLRVERTGATASSGEFFAGNGKVVVNSVSNTPLIFRTNNNERMRIDSSGNVGIGTSSPSNLLHLYKASGGNYSIVENTSGKAAFGVGSSGEVTISAESASNPIRFLTSSGGSERMRIDSSGNLLVGKTSTGIGTAGIQAEATGQLNVTKSGDAAVRAIRLSSDGDIVKFYKDTTTVGSIGTSGGRVYFADDATNGITFSNSSAIMYPSNSSGGVVDNTLDIGASSYRFKDLHLSGNVNAGGQIISSDSVKLTSNVNTPNGNTMFRPASNTLAFGTNSAERMRITNDKVQFSVDAKVDADNTRDLGASGARWKDLYLSGTANAANFNTTSDATLKTNVETLTGSLDAVKALRGVSYDWIDSGNSEVGVIAQEVEAVVPDVVSTNDQGIKSVKYGNLVGVLIEAIKEQQQRIEALEAKLNS